MSLNKPQQSVTFDNLKQSGALASMVGALALLAPAGCNDSAMPKSIDAGQTAEINCPETKCPEQKPCPEVDKVKTLCDELSRQVHVSYFQIKDNEVKDLCSGKKYAECPSPVTGDNCYTAEPEKYQLYTDNRSFRTTLGDYSDPQVGKADEMQNGVPVVCLPPKKKVATTTPPKNTDNHYLTDLGTGGSGGAGFEGLGGSGGTSCTSCGFEVHDDTLRSLTIGEAIRMEEIEK